MKEPDAEKSARSAKEFTYPLPDSSSETKRLTRVLVTGDALVKAQPDTAILMIAVAELAAQLTMWWIMYKVPEWSAKSEGSNMRCARSPVAPKSKRLSAVSVIAKTRGVR